MLGRKSDRFLGFGTSLGRDALAHGRGPAAGQLEGNDAIEAVCLLEIGVIAHD